jgi:MFS family permease
MMILSKKRELQLLLLIVAMAAAGYVRTAISPLQEAMRVALSLSDNEMALLQGPVIGIPVIIMSIPLGLLIDRRSRTLLLAVLVTLSGLASMLTATAPSFGSLLFARGLAGVLGLAIIPVVFALLADHYPPKLRGLATMLAILGQVAGNSAAFELGGRFLTMTGSGPVGWRQAMIWLCMPLVPVLMLMPLLREPPRIGVVTLNPSLIQVWRELQSCRGRIVTLGVGVILAEVVVGAIVIWAAPTLSRNYALPPEQVGTRMAAIMLVSGILGSILGGPLADLCQRTGGPKRTVSVLGWLSLLSVPAGLFAFLPNPTLAISFLVLSLTLSLAISVMGVTLFTIAIPVEVRGLCVSVLTALEVLFALAVGPPAVSLLSEAMGGLSTIGTALSIVCAAGGAITAFTFAVGRQNFQRVADPSRVRMEFFET